MGSISKSAPIVLFKRKERCADLGRVVDGINLQIRANIFLRQKEWRADLERIVDGAILPIPHQLIYYDGRNDARIWGGMWMESTSQIRTNSFIKTEGKVRGFRESR